MTTQQQILVVTPTLGESPFLDRTIEGVRSLPLDIQHLLACPERKIASLRERFPHCTVVPDAGREGGIYGALNAALEQAPAGWDWFTYINDDDELAPGFADMASQHFRRSEPEPVTYGNVRLIDDAGDPIAFITTETSPAYIADVLAGGISPLNQQGMLFHAAVVREIGRFDTRYRLCADLDFWLRAYVAGMEFRHYPMEVARFRLRQGQLSGEVARTISEQTEIVTRLLPAARSPLRSFWAKWRYRICNLPRYLQRARTVGWKTSNRLLGEGTPESGCVWKQ